MEWNDKEKKFLNIKQLKKAKETIRNYKQQINTLHRTFNKHLDEIEINDYIKFLGTIENKNTQNTYILILKNFYNTLEINMPTELINIKAEKTQTNHETYRKRCISNIEYNILINTVTNPRDKAIIELLRYTGFRRRELLSMKVNCITIDEKGFHVSCLESKTFPRNIKVFESLKFTLDFIKYHHQTKNPNDNLFLTYRNQKFKPMSNRTLNDIIEKASKKANIKHLHPHDFRHTRATELSKQNLNPQYLNYIMGWAEKSNMICNYNHTKMEEYEKQLETKHTEIKTFTQMEQENKSLSQTVNDLIERLNKMEKQFIQP